MKQEEPARVACTRRREKQGVKGRCREERIRQTYGEALIIEADTGADANTAARAWSAHQIFRDYKVRTCRCDVLPAYHVGNYLHTYMYACLCLPVNRQTSGKKCERGHR